MKLSKKGEGLMETKTVILILLIIGFLVVVGTFAILSQTGGGVFRKTLCHLSVGVEAEAEGIYIFGPLLSGRIGDFCYTEDLEVNGKNALEDIANKLVECTYYYDWDKKLDNYCNICFRIVTGNDVNDGGREEVKRYLQINNVPKKYSKIEKNYWNYVEETGNRETTLSIFPDNEKLEKNRKYLIIYNSDKRSLFDWVGSKRDVSLVAYDEKWLNGCYYG